MEWKAKKATFYQENEDMKNATRELIDTSFRKLRSAEGACDLLQSFKSIKSKGAIQKQVMNKFNDILEQFTRELDKASENFYVHQAKPPVSKNQPPIAGAIKWARGLLAKTKQTMSKLLATEGDIIKTTDMGQTVESKFKSFARIIKQFEDKLYLTWFETADSSTMAHLKLSVLKRSPETGIVEVNFHQDLTEMIHEARYLDRMGLKIPDITLNIALKSDVVHVYLEKLNMMLDRFYEAIEQLSPIERELMDKKISELNACLNPGFDILNWNSLAITEFIDSCNKKIGEFLQIVKSVQKSSSLIEDVVFAIAGTQIISEPKESPEVADLTEFYELVEKNRQEVIDKLVNKYKTMRAVLGKIEEVVAGSNTGKSPQLQSYYAFWERAIFNALNRMVLNAMGSLQNMIDTRKKAAAGHSKSALFKVCFLPPYD